MAKRKSASIGYAACPYGYKVQVCDENGSIMDEYEAGNSEHDSQDYVDPENGLSLQRLWQFAEQTAKEMAHEREIDHSFVYRDEDMAKSLKDELEDPFEGI